MRCLATMKSSTFAEKAKRALTHSGIDCYIVKIDPNLTKRGCSFALSFDCADADRVESIFTNKDVAYGDIIGRTNG